jgi:hypothetical protein
MFPVQAAVLRGMAFALSVGLVAIGGEAVALNSEQWIKRPFPGDVQHQQPYSGRGWDRGDSRRHRDDDRRERPRHEYKHHAPQHPYGHYPRQHWAPRTYYQYYQPPIFEWWWKWQHVPRHMAYRLPPRPGCDWRLYEGHAYLVERGSNIIVAVIANFY